mmetsp:Transcript_49219/g.107058  ORF Transcript_49219/g.107058 Transcript_49219/m.107058 type:complete len:135 (-) Transcript_49219:36-440(-)
MYNCALKIANQLPLNEDSRSIQSPGRSCPDFIITNSAEERLHPGPSVLASCQNYRDATLNESAQGLAISFGQFMMRVHQRPVDICDHCPKTRPGHDHSRRATGEKKRGSQAKQEANQANPATAEKKSSPGQWCT